MCIRYPSYRQVQMRCSNKRGDHPTWALEWCSTSIQRHGQKAPSCGWKHYKMCFSLSFFGNLRLGFLASHRPKWVTSPLFSSSVSHPTAALWQNVSPCLSWRVFNILLLGVSKLTALCALLLSGSRIHWTQRAPTWFIHLRFPPWLPCTPVKSPPFPGSCSLSQYHSGLLTRFSYSSCPNRAPQIKWIILIKATTVSNLGYFLEVTFLGDTSLQKGKESRLETCTSNICNINEFTHRKYIEHCLHLPSDW